MSGRRSEILVGVLASAGAVALVTAAVALVEPYVPVLSLGVVYVFAVLPVAVLWGLAYAIPVSVASMLAFNWFYLPPTHTFALQDGANWFALAVYLVTAVVVSDLAARARRRAREAEQREREAALLAQIGSALLQGVGVREELELISAQTAEVLGVAAAAIELGQGGAGYPLRAGGREVGRLVVPTGELPDAAALARFLPPLASLLAVAQEDAVKTALLRTVSHDFRSPLTAIAAAVDGLENAELALDEGDRAGLLETIRLESSRLGRLVANLLDLSRLEAGGATPRPELWTVDELVGQALDGLPGSERVDVELDEELRPVELDAAQLQRALANLLENALKFSPGRVRVLGRETGEFVRIEVLDDGPGIAEEQVERVFEPFQGSGTGLGLAIARGFAEANGARLWAEPGAGGRFVLALPVPATVSS
jgi:two-component system, OmpR family, sensor histidine kinase KdpD